MLKILISVLVFTIFSLTQALKYETKKIDFNSVYNEKIIQPEMKFYSVTPSSDLNDNDLLIESLVTKSPKNNFYESPLILVSLKPLPNTDKNSQWVCGQLGLETCFIPNKYLSKEQKVYIGILCEDCEYSLKASFVNEEILKDGENKLFHLKAGDTKIFKLEEFFQAEEESIKISSFNLKMSKYKMEVKIIDKSNEKNMIEVPVSQNWIGGLQAMIKPKANNYVSKYQYKIILTAIENGVFNIEAKTSKAIVPLSDKTLKFDSVKLNEKLCYSYKINKESAGNNFKIDVKSIKGDVSLEVSPLGVNGNPLQFTILNEKDLKYDLTSAYRQSLKSESGIWKICATTKNENAFYTIQVYQDENGVKVKEYKKLLMGKIITFDLI